MQSHYTVTVLQRVLNRAHRHLLLIGGRVEEVVAGGGDGLVGPRKLGLVHQSRRCCGAAWVCNTNQICCLGRGLC